MVARRQVAIVVDSGACLPPGIAEEGRVQVVPHTLIIDGVALRDGVDVGPAEFHRLLEQGRATIATSAPSPGDFLRGFEAAGELAPEVLCIVVASRFSAACAAAESARLEARRSLPGLRIEVMDSHTAAGAAGLLALEAAQAAEAGLGLRGVVERAERVRGRLRLLATVDDLSYLRRSGRVGWLGFSAGWALSIRPVFELREGEPRLLARPRSRSRAIASMLEHMRTMADGAPVYVNVMGAGDEAESLRREVESQFECRAAFVSRAPSVIGAHTGPSLLGVAFHTAEQGGAWPSPGV